ncbi:MAG TPA: T9SS type A sorting domain-containing protein [Draconibacterium sp.]|nr:T9SS type A sorting domain-containing protein [Draconibacterium sp.]
MKTLSILIFSLFAVLTSVAQRESKLQPFQPSSEGENSQTKSEMRFADPNKTYKTSLKLKSATTEMQRLDSTVIQSYNQNTGLWINSYKYVAEYDSAGNQTINLALNWSSTTSTWENWSKTDFDYNSDGKLLSEIRFGWDKISNTWINKSKYEYAYDTEGNLILNAYYSWVGNPAFWKGINKSEFAFDSFGNQILNVSFVWNSSSNVWEGKEKYEKIFDATGNKTREAFFKWRFSDFGEQESTYGWANEYVDTLSFNENNLLQRYLRGHWSPDSTTFYYQTKKDYEYDANDSLTQITTFNIDNTDNSWITESREEYIYESGKTTYTYYLTNYVSDTLRKTNLRETLYNSNGFIISEIKYYRSASSDSLVGDTKYEYSYHADGIHVFESQYYRFDVAQNKWIPQEKMQYPTYDSFGNKTEIVKSIWDVSTENWKFFSKLINNYNSNNIATLLSSYSWNESINDWVGYSKYEYIYDENDNLINSSNYSWDAVRNDWKGKSRRENLYDKAFTIDDLILPVWISTVNIYNKPLQFLDYSWNPNSNNWIEFQLKTMYYSDVVISKVSVPVLSDVKVYPNPATDKIYIDNLDDFKEYSILNSQGMTVKSGILNDYSNTISIVEFSPGLYFVHLKGENRAHSAKILKQ